MAVTRRKHRTATLEKYGLNRAAYSLLRADQDGVCAICSKPEDAQSSDGKALPLCIDHDHQTERVRGLLCSKCNIMLGWLEKLDREKVWTEQARSYLVGGIFR